MLTKEKVESMTRAQGERVATAAQTAEDLKLLVGHKNFHVREKARTRAAYHLGVDAGYDPIWGLDQGILKRIEEANKVGNKTLSGMLTERMDKRIARYVHENNRTV